jgi:hypothetical protein
MKKLKFTLIAVVSALALTSCGGGTEAANGEGFASLEKEVKTKFGENAYFTDLTVSYVESIGNVVSVNVTEDPESLKMGEWNLTNGTWNQTSEITLEVSEGSKASDFMFQLKDKFSMKALGDLVEESIEKLKAEKKIEEPVLSMAFIMFPDDGDISKAKYCVKLEPKTGGTSFSYYYQIDGTFIEMNY